MSELKIRVGASVDRNLAVAFRPLVDGANRAAAAINSTSVRAGQAVAAGTKKGTDAADKEYTKLVRSSERWQREAVRNAERAAAGEAKAAATATRAHERAEAAKTVASEREAKNRTRAAERALRTQEASAKRIWRQGQINVARDQDRQLGLARSTFGGVASGLGLAGNLGARGVRTVLGAASSAVHGMGVETDVGSIVQKNSELQTSAQKISNSGYMAGDERNGTRVDARALQEQALSVGAKTGTDANVALEGLDKFVAKTGDLQSGREILERMAVLSKATGSSLEDMMNGAGDVANALGDVDNKGQLIKDVMRSFAAQGKMGAVEIKNLASQMAKVGAASSMFTGERSDVMAQMGALTQMTRAKGGASSATQAATSLGSFTNVFSKGARLDKFQAHGVEVYGKDQKVRAPIEIIKDALRKTGGDNRKMGEMFADVAARRVTRGFETTYKDAGGGEAGIKAVQEAFDRLKNATIADSEVAESFARQMSTAQSQTEVFNQTIRKSALEMQEQLTPALLALAPAVIDATKSLVGVVTWLSGDQQLKRINDKVKQDVPDAIKSTEKQLAGGKISMAQKDMNRVAEAEAREGFSRASAELEQAKKDAEELKNDKSVNHTAAKKMDAILGTDTSGEKASDEKVAAAAKTMEEARKAFLDIRSENAKVSELLRQGIVVTVKNPAGGPALSTPNAGVEPPPGL